MVSTGGQFEAGLTKPVFDNNLNVFVVAFFNFKAALKFDRVILATKYRGRVCDSHKADRPGFESSYFW